jgi:hypothetical protein
LLDTSDPLAILQGLVREPTRIEALRRLVSESDLDAGLGSLIQVSGWIFSDVWLEDVRTQAHARLRARATEPDPGLTASTLLGREPWVPTIVPLLDLETEAGKLYLPGHKRSAIASASAADVERALAGADLKPFHVDDRGLALHFERQGTLVRLGDGTVIGTAAYERARTVLLEECARAETITLARYRDLLGVSRRVAQLLLERLDSDRVTLRIGDIRRVRRNSAKS